MKKYKYYADEWLDFHDLTNELDIFGINMLMVQGVQFIPPNELVYLNGAKALMYQQIAFTIGVNKVIRSNPKKYMEILKRPDRRIKLDLFENGQQVMAKPKKESLSYVR